MEATKKALLEQSKTGQMLKLMQLGNKQSLKLNELLCFKRLKKSRKGN